ncbi:peroxide stress protein YaaA [Helicobacter sp. 11S03491-1]|uniref:peroxide stress protein YaaA n=1 Tax=Helicobacter sp. 11S03491-1 TaxID=1476196 RepID=UPI000BA5C5F8|nr:peroxide stress protein YaaA [Helicobacter sp. 11S03491-1]PAF41723.1 hypothetical protein BKH45_06450 [Helicobacter sp. 11S03491-1]
MKILFSPSEGKKFTQIISEKDDFSFLNQLIGNYSILSENIARYIDIFKKEDTLVCKLFGIKNLSSKSVLDEISLCSNIAKSSKIQAIKLYQGVAYKALDFDRLPLQAQHYILENVMICSNLFGIVRSSDFLPFYKYNQNFKYEDFGLYKLYKKLADDFNNYLKNEEILDLRAEIYIKAYQIKNKHTRIEFLHKGKKISHYAKYYRGIYLRELSQAQDKELERLEIKGLELIDKKYDKNIMILTYEID